MLKIRQPQLPERVRENRLRRLATRKEIQLTKSRGRNPQFPEYGRFMLIDPFTNTVIAGAYPSAFSLNLDEVEAELAER